MYLFFFFFFKQKTAYEMRISDLEFRRVLFRSLALPWLAKSFRITGGNIRNASTTAAFLAAEREHAITMEDIVRGIDREFEKLGRLCTEADFRSEERRVGKEWDRTCSSRWAPSH